jgi:hypothetical protein
MEASEQRVSHDNGHVHDIPPGIPGGDEIAQQTRLHQPAPRVGDLFEIDTGDRTLRVGAGPIHGRPDAELVEALCAARQEIDTVPKNGYNNYLDHEYATYDDVMRAVAEPMAEAGVWCFPSVVDTFKQYAGQSKQGVDQYTITVVLEAFWTAGDSTIRSYWVGETIDSGDKHHYQLLSQVTKYALAKTLMLDTGDADVDADHVEPTKASSGQASTSSGPTEAASERQQSYIRDLQERCQARGASQGEYEILATIARSKSAASEQIEQLQKLEEDLGGENE